jgi:hypothetical protein
MERKSAGQMAYESDIAARPTYHNGCPRPSWAELWPAARHSWERTATAR